MATFRYEFEWDPEKAESNRFKHGVDFERASQIFRDPLALTVLDEEHSETEVRWITLGRDREGRDLAVIHTFEELPDAAGRIRLISARPATSAEIRAYEEEQ
jgi:uncharacterized DUF497 family protein